MGSFGNGLWAGSVGWQLLLVFIILEQLGVRGHRCRCRFLGSGLTLLSLRADAPGEAFTLNLTNPAPNTHLNPDRWEGTLIWLVFSSGLTKNRWLDGVPAGCCPHPLLAASFMPLHAPAPAQMKVKAVCSSLNRSRPLDTQGLSSVRTGLSQRPSLLFPISVYSSM